MVIRTITCHNVYNYGASLQAYALQSYLESLANDVEIIDFQPVYHQNRYNLFYISDKSKFYAICKKMPVLACLYNLLRNFSMFKTWGRKNKFDKFTAYYLKLTSTRYETSEQLKKNPPKADIYIAGSDQIWNTKSDNGKEPAYYLDFGDEFIRRYSYAASFAISELDKKLKNFVRAHVSKLDKVSVREKTGIDILKNLQIEATQVMDPVFLLSKENWKKLIDNASVYNLPERYILVYDFLFDEQIKNTVLELKEKYNLSVVSINDFMEISYADININDAGPLEFLSLIYNSDIVVSSSFHATAFSLIFEKNFYVYPLKGHNNSSRMTDFLDDLNLIERYKPEHVSFDYIIDYSFVNKLLNEKINASRLFINQILS